MYGLTSLPLGNDADVWFRFTLSLFKMPTRPSSLATSLINSVTMFSIITINCLGTIRNSWTNYMKFNENSIHMFVASPPPCSTLHFISEKLIWNIFRTIQLLLIALTMKWRIIWLSRILLMFVVNFCRSMFSTTDLRCC